MDQEIDDQEQVAAIDLGVLEDLERSVGDDRAFLRELVETYLDDTPTLVAAMRSGIAQGNVEQTNRAAHTLKSNSASLGALGLSAMARELETLTAVATTEAEDLAAPEISALVEVIAAEFEEARRELDALVPGTAAD